MDKKSKFWGNNFIFLEEEEEENAPMQSLTISESRNELHANLTEQTRFQFVRFPRSYVYIERR